MKNHSTESGKPRVYTSKCGTKFYVMIYDATDDETYVREISAEKAASF